MLLILSQANVLHSPMYAIVMDFGGEAVGGRGAFRRLAGVAVPAGRTDAAMAQRVCMVRAGSAALGFVVGLAS